MTTPSSPVPASGAARRPEDQAPEDHAAAVPVASSASASLATPGAARAASESAVAGMPAPGAAVRTAHDGFALPALGLGTYKLKGREGAAAIAAGIDAGYRLIDSAFNYENEGAIGLAIRESGIPREELIVASKLPGRRHAKDEARVTIEESALRLGVDVIDLYLIHWPNPSVDRYVEAWEALIEARERGLVRAIGVSNFLPEHLERLERETGVRPSVNQIELHPAFPQLEQVGYHDERGILTQAWSPLGRQRGVLDHPAIAEIARAHDATPEAVTLAWMQGRGIIPIPKSSSPERQRANLAAMGLQLDAAEVAAMNALGRSDGRLADQDPSRYEEM